jgi:hypothetical protein
MESHPPGWLPDPLGRYQYRYWDGGQWTSAVSTNGSQETDPMGVASSAQASPVAAARSRPDWSSTVRWLVLGGALVVIVGSVLPWVQADAGVFSFTKSGIDGDGALTLALAVALGAVFLLGRHSAAVGWSVLAFAGVILAIALYDVVDVTNKARELADSSPLVEFSAHVGFGLWMTVAGGAATFLGGIVALAGRPRVAGGENATA